MTDPNSPNRQPLGTKEPPEQTTIRNKGVREVREGVSASPTTTSTTTTRVVPTVSKMRGCISTTVDCTQDTEHCRIFNHRKVANVFCKCTPKLCLGVASQGDKFNLQCSMKSSRKKKKKSKSLSGAGALSPPKLPFFCQFIPFFSYNNNNKKR